ncbi:MAG: hypothetical protein ABI729_03460 [Chitinophagales bacterium]
MANQSQALFRLIHSLTQSEKRYFSIGMTTQRESSAFLKVFKCIDRQEVYDEAMLKQQLKKESFVNHLSVIKVQLYHFLLKTLRNFHESRSVDFRLKELMMNAAILNEKALYNESSSAVKRARELALKFEDWKVLLEILHKEYTLAQVTVRSKQLANELHRINTDEKKFIAQLNNYGELAYLALSLSMLLRKLRNAKKLSGAVAIRKILKDPVLKNEKKAISFRAKSLFHYIWSSYYMASCQFEKAEHHLTQQINSYHENRHFLEAAPGNYLGALNDLLLSRYRTRQYNIVMQMIDEFKSLPDSNEIKRITSRRFRMVIFSGTFKTEIGVAIQTNSLQEHLPVIQQQETLFNRHGNVMEPRRRLETILALATMYFHLYNRKKAVQLVEQLLQDEAAILHHDLNVLARVLQIVLHFDDGSYDVLTYLVSGLKRFVARIKETSKMEKQLLEFAGRLETLHRKKNPHTFFEEQYKKFADLRKDRFEVYYFDYFDITEWLKQKMKRKSLS